MTNIELIRQEIERRIGAMYNFSSGYSALNVCRELLDFIDSLPKEEPIVLTPENRPDLFDENGHIDWGKLNPPPNVSTSPGLNKIDLKEAAEEYAKDETMAGLAERAFKAGANWQKEQDKETIELAEDHAMLAGMVKQEEEMKEKALEVTVYPDDDGYPCIPEIVLFDFDKNQPTAKEGDKVKVYIFKN